VKKDLTYRIKSKSVEISFAIVIGLAALFWTPSPVKGMGMSLISIPIAPIHLQKSPDQKAQEVRITPAVRQRLDKIRYDAVTVKKMLPLMYLNRKSLYINEEILKNLRGGDLRDFYYGIFLMTVLAVIFSSMDSGEAYALFQKLQQLNAPNGQSLDYQPSTSQQEINGRQILRQCDTTLWAQYYPYEIGITQAELFSNPDGSPNIDKGYQEVMRRAQNCPDFSCSRQRFIELSTEVKMTIRSMREAISALQLEATVVVSNVRRDPLVVNPEKMGCDFLANGPNGETHLEIKGPVDSKIKAAKSGRTSIPKQGKRIGK